MGKICLVTGGVRSGKSDFAEQQIWHEQDVCYIATGVMHQKDEEFSERIKQHQERRPSSWATLEQYYDLAQCFAHQQHKTYLLDCVTMLTTNILFDKVATQYPDKMAMADDDFLTREQQSGLIDQLLVEWQAILRSIKASSATVWMVTNEVGMGIVPETRLGRFYRDLQGKINQLIAKEADEVYLVICGLSQRLK
ncbi:MULTISPECIES: bifunctional adenosylcobinamide kinase/adenosylcobinamide-phosphate guanylyltransferase [unclassified Granulicatella]|uniref:bifunctional adenosylcobinamide kinase/adenosylcobinamide-phosphate guanylyltransferase n=1 Tax=unclassified Granulicatella TaxID=2630493 RepID=UPI00107473FC|nr:MULTISPECIES: bifunctional adenosylcobinamide kinase/adenosylcobinamide-phosphate guanylyltransferase [unclassified Granulicatella]MBF0779535.1 bifunctional adenosylcobinamide kinase/adenosylcobinamide-phosphate guanylyltransferase [Granulicatella sp. 19428wC4_WM01]TFU96500.1 bifunctional adenosylcobinamide kinase/adenosylcobinamide-phosphate guanylyltransferase [Granulicatella sp. WM01]